ncbi:MAG: ammonia-forming cytochrome c nitrite reductase subunit c552 [Gemmatimonadota bacterium]
MADTGMRDPQRGTGWKKWVAVAALAGLVVAFSGAALLGSIMDRKAEAANPFYRVVELTDTTTDPAVWGKNFPLQYESYLRTAEMEKTRYGGSYAVPWTPTEEWDDRDSVSFSKIEKDPRLVRMWAGYGFALDFREERGHAYMLEDQRTTRRTRDIPQPGTCLNCHASTHAANVRAGDGDLMAGWEKINQMPYHEATALVEHPVSCVDCHEPETMELRITRPAFVEGIAALKASQGVEGYDPNQHATRQEMRSYVCAQCHVEYHFEGETKRLNFPWDNGLQAEDALAFYDAAGFTDWTHAETGAPMLKAQHPEYEMFTQGIHARAGVACADCHMPYKREGAMKISDHHVNSPMLKVNEACQSCHRASEEEMLDRVADIQDRHLAMLNLAFDALVELIDDIAEIHQVDPNDPRLPEAREYQRKASFLVDWVEAENSVGFHAPQEAARVLTQALDYTRKGQLALRGEQQPVTRTAGTRE